MNTPIVVPYTIEPYIPNPAFPEQQFVSRPVILTNLEYDGRTLPFTFGSIVDSGADTCVFPAEFGEKLGVSVREGKPRSTRGIGSDTAYYHSIKVCIELQGEVYRFDCWAGFMYSLDEVGKGLLGRHGFFALFESIAFKKNQIELMPLKTPVDQPQESLPF